MSRVLVVKSKGDTQDAAAASLITEQMIKNDCDRIVWYSSMGDKVSEMVKATERMAKLEELCSSLLRSQLKMAKEVADLKFALADSKKSVQNLDEEMTRLTRYIDEKIQTG